MSQFIVINVVARFNSGSGGPPRTVIAVARAGINRWSSHLITTAFTEPDSDQLLIAEYPGPVQLLPLAAQTLLGGSLSALGVWSLSKKISLNFKQPTVLHLHGIWSPLFVELARVARRQKIPYIVAPHGMLEPWSLSVRSARKSFALKTYQGSIFRHASGVHTTSEAELNNVVGLNLTPAPLFVIPNAIETPQLQPTAKWSEIPRKRLLFLSRVHPKKGLDMLLDAWAQLNPQEWELRIVGNGETSYVNALRQRCADQRIGHVSFQGHVDGLERENEFARASAFILPTFSENFGNVVGEAMLRSLPVITTTGTPWTAVSEQNLGWYVEPNLPGILDALTGLFRTSENEMQAMAARGRAYVQAQLSVAAVSDRLFHMYRTVLGLSPSQPLTGPLGAANIAASQQN